MIVLIDNYDSFTFNLFHYLGELGAEVVVHRNDKVTVADVVAADPEAIVLSPGPCTPDDAGICLDLINAATATIPLFGVCLGHQAIGQVFGGINGPFQATRYHSLVVDRASMPEELATIAETDDRLVMGLAHKTLPVHGVQFHPESIASEHGHLILKNFLDLAAAWNANRRPRRKARARAAQ